MNDTTTKLQELLDNPEHPANEAIARLYEWSTNFQFPTPYSLFLDLIGYSKDELDYNLVTDPSSLVMGYLELSLLGEALSVVGQYGESAYDYAVAIVNAEVGEDN